MQVHRQQDREVLLQPTIHNLCELGVDGTNVLVEFLAGPQDYKSSSEAVIQAYQETMKVRRGR